MKFVSKLFVMESLGGVGRAEVKSGGVDAVLRRFANQAQ